MPKNVVGGTSNQQQKYKVFHKATVKKEYEI